uniref:BPTI/Kunitz inhibitor domain-containing protein n=1 Tax=Junco hyemalis TaxID=40217 RepID=A0A8C5JRT5_JUNHY
SKTPPIRVCQLPCGMLSRFFYNSSSMACETFHYGGCLGNGNNFYSEKECLQYCGAPQLWLYDKSLLKSSALSGFSKRWTVNTSVCPWDVISS